MNRFTASILVTLAPLCLFTGAVLEVGIRPAIAQEVPATPQEIEALRAEGDRLFSVGNTILQSCKSSLAFIPIRLTCPDYETEYQQALRYFQQALIIYQLFDEDSNSNKTQNQQRTLQAFYRIGDVHYRLGNYSASLDWYQQALEFAQQVQDSVGEAKAFNRLGNAYRKIRAFDAALASYNRALEIWQKNQDSAFVAETYNQLGLLYYSSDLGAEALEYFQQALEIYQQLGDLEAEVDIWIYMGWTLNPMGHEDQALSAFLRALDIAERLGDRHRQGQLQNFIGSTHRFLGQYQQSLVSFEKSLTLLRQEPDFLARSLEASTLVEMMIIYQRLGHLEYSIRYGQEARSIYEEQGDLVGLNRVLIQLGVAYNNFFQLDTAVEVLEEALPIARELNDQFAQARALEALADSYSGLARHEEAILNLESAIRIWQEMGEPQRESRAYQKLGYAQAEQGSYEEAVQSFQNALGIAQELDNLLEQVFALLGLGNTYERIDLNLALSAYSQGLSLIRILDGSPPIEIIYFTKLGDLFHEKSQKELAILFYKQVLKITEEVRQDIQSLPLELQQSYTESVADTYRILADLLLQQDRVLEAQRVLDLLKVQELDDYLRDVRGNEQTVTGVEFLPPEAELSALYDRAIAQGIELTELREIPLSDRTPAQQARLAELVATQQDLTLSFDAFVNHPDVQDLVAQLTRTARRQNLDLEYLTAIQDNLRNLEQNAVLLYPLILDDRLELILVTPYAPPIRRTVNVTRVDLNQAIVDLRHFLNSPFSTDSRPAQQLYQWLIQPIAADLAAAQAETIVYAPDGPLRYVPLAALQDGDQWLIEQFRITHITAASLTDFNTVPQDRLQVFAGAFANGVVEVEVGDRQLQYGGLPFAGSEVAAIAATIPNTTTLLDEDFSPAATLPILDDHTIVHLATHAEFVSGRPDQSFILFGNGEHVTLRDIATWSLSHVDLVVLSACQTAVGDELGNGEEILGFGYQIQRTGAKAAIASLWPVSDAGTQALMAVFYSALAQGMAKAEALQAAQISLINEPSVAATGPQRSITVIGDRQEINTATVPTYNHPYYWAPFILIGNGL
jgi:CHAT domain-containing protein/tetratricopeptide (TPR) repeat protein